MIQNKITFLIGVLLGVVISALFLHYFNAKKIAPIIAERDATPVIALNVTRIKAQQLLEQIERDPNKIHEASVKWMIANIEAFISSYEEFNEKYPHIKTYDEYYNNAFEFLEEYKNKSDN